jgi:uncharacterized membrane protein HdeD (DUF308 family)
MSEHAATPHFGGHSPVEGLREKVGEVTGYWWVGLVTGIAWLAIALTILQFDHASITTIGVLVGLLFVLAGAQNIALAAVADSMRWLWALFGVMFLAAAVVCFIRPESTFAGLADILGFVFLLVGVGWMIRAFLERPVNPIWWLGLISGILMTCMAFWTAGQFFFQRAYILLAFAGVWALMEGMTSIVRAFAVRRVHEDL